MTYHSQTVLSLAIAISFSMAGCSSSDGSSPVINDPQTGEPSTSSPPFALDAKGHDLIRKLGGYELEVMAQEAALMGELAANTAASSSPLQTGGYNVSDRDQIQLVSFVANRYDCALGGQVIIETSELKISESDYSRSFETAEYRFDQCQVEDSGEHVLSGVLSLSEDSISGIGFSTYEESLKWSQFSWQQPGGNTINFDADTRINDVTTSVTRSSREVSIDQFVINRDGQVVEQINGATFNVVNETSAAGAVQEYILSADGQILDPSGVRITIDTDPILHRKLVFGGIDVVAIPFTGAVTMSADDNSELVYTATTASDTDTLQVDVDYRDSDGMTTTSTAQNFVELETVIR